MLMWQNLGNLPLFRGLNDLKKKVGHCDFPDDLSQWLKDSTLAMQGAQVPSSVEKLRSHISHDVARKKKKQRLRLATGGMILSLVYSLI